MTTLALLLLLAAEWQVLFDGRNLDAFDRHQAPGRESVWQLEDGWIHRVAPQPGVRRLAGDLATRESFADFELEFEWKIATKGNSGVKYRVQGYLRARPGTDGKKRDQLEVRPDFTHGVHDFSVWPIGFEYQLFDDREAKDKPTDVSGSLYDILPAKHVPLEPGTVHRSRIVVRGSHVEHWLDGAKVVDTDLRSEAVLAPLRKNLEVFHKITDAEYRFDREQLAETLLSAKMQASPILLQDHDTEVWFRAIRIRRI